MTDITININGAGSCSPIVSPTGTLELVGGSTTLTVGPTIVSGVDHTDLSSIGTNTHAAIDTHIADTSIHFTSPLSVKGDIWCRNATVSAKRAVGTDGQLLIVSAADSTGLSYGAAASTSSFISKTTFNASDAAWVIPALTKRLIITVFGGGGGGGYGGGGFGGSGGGSGSAIVRFPVRGVIPGNTLAIVIGAGGLGGTRTPGTVVSANGNPSSVTYAADVNGLAFALTGYAGGSGSNGTSGGKGGAGGGSGSGAVADAAGSAGSRGGIAGPAGTTGAGADNLMSGFWATGACGGALSVVAGGGDFLGRFNGGACPDTAASSGGGGAAGFGGPGTSGSNSGNAAHCAANSGAGGGGGVNGAFNAGNGGSGSATVECWSD